MSEHDTLINSLSRNLAPVKNTISVNLMGMGWFIGSALYVMLVTHLFGPIRPTALAQLVSEPRFLAETVLGLAAILSVSLIAFRSAIPGMLSGRLKTVGIVLMSAWLASYGLGMVNPALEPSMLGKRDHCYLETFIYALPPMLSAFYLVRRMYPLRPAQTALAFSLAAGMLPALYMQIACMYSPQHILSFHILPGLMIVPAGMLLARVGEQ